MIEFYFLRCSKNEPGSEYQTDRPTDTVRNFFLLQKEKSLETKVKFKDLGVRVGIITGDKENKALRSNLFK